ncbi:MAG: M20/M25/M40 family metallo-hydrolase, partial [Erysipelothrix sp.]
STSEEVIINQLEKLGETYQFTVKSLKGRKPLYVASDHPLIQALKQAYQEVMHEEAHCITKGGASYARVMNAGVAFGATFEGEDPQPHMPNEKMPVASLMKATDIYIESLKILSSSQ